MKTEAQAFWPVTRPSLLLQIRDGTAQDAWRIFVETYTPIVYRYCRIRALQDSDAADVTQEVLAKVQRFEYDPARGKFRGWLATVTQREIARCRAKLKRASQGIGGSEPEEQFDHLIEAPGTDLDWERIANAHILERAIETVRAEFSREEWQAFEAVGIRVVATEAGKQAVWQENPCYARVAQELGKSETWLYKVKHRVMKRLREEVVYLGEELGVLT